MAKDNRSVGRFILDGIPAGRRGEPQIEVTFDMDANGILSVSAKEKVSGKEQSIRIEASTGLSDEEIEKMVQDAESHAAEDKKFESLITARNQADGLVHATKKTLTEAADKVEAQEKEKIEAAITALEEALKDDSLEEIEAKTKDLTDSSSGLVQRMYAEAQASAEGAQGPSADAGESSSGDDDAVDAEFEEVKEDEK